MIEYHFKPLPFQLGHGLEKRLIQYFVIAFSPYLQHLFIHEFNYIILAAKNGHRYWRIGNQRPDAFIGQARTSVYLFTMITPVGDVKFCILHRQKNVKSRWLKQGKTGDQYGKLEKTIRITNKVLTVG